MINANDLIALFRQALSEKWGYIWGTAGVTWTAARQAALEKTTDGSRANSRRYGSKWIGKKVADCSGLFSWAFKQLGGTMYHGSNTMYLKWCAAKGELKNGKRTDFATLKPGTAVFCWDGSTYSHVGLYVGEGTVIEAAGAREGVTTSPVTATKWKFWGELSGVGYGAGNGAAGSPSAFVPAPPAGGEPPERGEADAVSASAPAGRPTLRRGSRGEAVREMQAALEHLGYSLAPYGADGDFGKVTEAAVRVFQKDRGLTTDGVCGPLTWAALTSSPAAPSAHDTYAVRIGGLDLSQAKALMLNYPGATMEKEE